MKTSAILFDFDGVLTLDETGSQSICRYISNAAGIDPALMQREYRKYNPGLLKGQYKHEDIWEELCNGIGRTIPIDVLYQSFIATPINPDMLNLVQNVKKSGYQTGLVTDNKTDRIAHIIRHHGWESLFDGIAVSAEIGSGKDSEDIFIYILKQLNLKPEECIFIDNKEDNLIIPQAFGMHTIFFDFHQNDMNKLISQLSDLQIKLFHFKG